MSFRSIFSTEGAFFLLTLVMICLAAYLFIIKRAHRRREKFLNEKVLQASILKELTQRIGYTFDVKEIAEVISGSLGQIIPFATVSYLIYDGNTRKAFLKIDVRGPVSGRFLAEVKERMFAAFKEMRKVDSLQIEEEKMEGMIPDDSASGEIGSFFNLPLVIGSDVAGLINVAAPQRDLYSEKETEILYSITALASDAVHKLAQVIENEQHKMNAMVSSLPSGLLMVDAKYRIAVINEAMKNILHIGSGAVGVFDVADAARKYFDFLLELESVHEKKVSKTLHGVNVEGKYYEVIFSPVIDAEGKYMGLLVLFNDITAERAIGRIRDEFTAMIVHDLRAPLTAMRWTIDALPEIKTKNQEAITQSMGTVYQSIEKMLGIVNDLLDISKIEAGKFQILAVESDLGEIIRKKIEEFDPQIKGKGLLFAADISKKLPKFAFDPMRIDRVITNFLSNAVKFTDKGSVAIRARLDEQSNVVRVEVADTGRGIPKDMEDRLFQKFVQLDSAGKVKGTGLGLAITKGFVEAHGGRVGYLPNEGGGSIFWFELPVKRE